MIAWMTLMEEKRKCCGCSACVNICPEQIICMKTDEEGFLYPYVSNIEQCSGCALCEKVCLYINRYESVLPDLVLACKCKDESIRKSSTSGGIFSVLAESVLNAGGVVFGASFNKNYELVHSCAHGADYTRFRGSKYVQSKLMNTFTETKQYLESGKEVLFSGTPCQISGLRHYLSRDYDKLLCVDFICHGVPSPMILNTYLDEISRKYNSQSKCINFRTKEGMWKRRTTTTFTQMCDGSIITTQRDPYMLGFLQNLFLRPSCHNCAANNFRSRADVTIGDYWGAETKYKNFDDERGVSLMMIHSIKGAAVFEMVKDKLEYLEADLSHALIFNPNIIQSSCLHKHRNDFFKALNGGQTFSELINKYTTTRIEIVREILTPRQIRMIQLLLAKMKGKLMGFSKFIS